jgi:hypothetical protein
MVGGRGVVTGCEGRTGKSGMNTAHLPLRRRLRCLLALLLLDQRRRVAVRTLSRLLCMEEPLPASSHTRDGISGWVERMKKYSSGAHDSS